MEIKDFKWMIGLSLSDAKNKIQEPFFINIDRNDNKTFYKTFEFNRFRVNVEIEKGKIVQINNIL